MPGYALPEILDEHRIARIHRFAQEDRLQFSGDDIGHEARGLGDATGMRGAGIALRLHVALEMRLKRVMAPGIETDTGIEPASIRISPN